MAQGRRNVIEIIIEALDKSGPALDKAKKGLKDFRSTAQDVSKDLTLAGGAITGALSLVLHQSVATGEGLAIMAKNTGLSVEQYSRLAYAVQVSDSSLEAFQVGTRRVAALQRDAAGGNKEAIKTFDDLGIAYRDSKDELLPLLDVVLAASNKFSAMENAQEAAALAQELFGRGAQDLLPFLRQGSDAIQKLGEESDRLGATWDTKTATAADALDDNLTRVKLAAGGVGREILGVLAPALTEYTNKLARDVIPQTAAWIRQHPDVVKAVGITGVALVGAGGLVGGLAITSTALVNTVAAVNLLSTALKGLSGAQVIAALGGIGALGTVALGVAATAGVALGGAAIIKKATTIPEEEQIRAAVERLFKFIEGEAGKAGATAVVSARDFELLGKAVQQNLITQDLYNRVISQTDQSIKAAADSASAAGPSFADLTTKAATAGQAGGGSTEPWGKLADMVGAKLPAAADKGTRALTEAERAAAALAGDIATLNRGIAQQLQDLVEAGAKKAPGPKGTNPVLQTMQDMGIKQRPGEPDIPKPGHPEDLKAVTDHANEATKGWLKGFTDTTAEAEHDLVGVFDGIPILAQKAFAEAETPVRGWSDVVLDAVDQAAGLVGSVLGDAFASIFQGGSSDLEQMQQQLERLRLQEQLAQPGQEQELVRQQIEQTEKAMAELQLQAIGTGGALAKFGAGFVGIMANVVASIGEAIAKMLILKGLFSLIPGLGGIASALPFNFFKFAEGGLVPGAGNQDRVLAALTPGELVLNRAQVRALGAAPEPSGKWSPIIIQAGAILGTEGEVMEFVRRIDQKLVYRTTGREP